MSSNRSYGATTGLPGKRNVGVTPYIRPIHAFFDVLTGGSGGPAERFARLAKYETCVLITGTQSGKTDSILDIMGWVLSVRPRPLLYVGPSRDFVSDQFEPRLSDMIGGASELSVDELRSKKLLKIVNGVRVRLAWGGSATSLASDQAAVALVDEYDKMFRAQRRTGDPFVLAKARADTYADRKILVTSTPEQGAVTTKKDPVSGLEFWDVADPAKIDSRIWLRWQNGTRHHVAWKCPCCGEWFIPRMKDLKFPEGATTGAAKRETFLRCPANGCVIEETHKEAMNAGFTLVAPGETIRADGTVDGEPIDTDTLTIWASGLTSPFITWGERVAELLNAQKSGEPEAIQGAMNKAGELYSPIEVKAIAAEHIKTKVADYRFGQVPGEVLRVTMGADVQGNRIVYTVRGWGARARSWLLERGQVYGPTADDEVWAKFALVYQTNYAGLRIEKAVIDAGFRPDKPQAGDYHRVLDHCRQYSWVATPSRGKGRQSVPIIPRLEEVTADGKRDSFGLTVLSVDSDYFKSLWFSRLNTTFGNPGSAHFPSDVDDDYARQVVSEIRSDDGSWHKVHPQNHFLDAEALAGVAAYLLEVHNIPDGSFRSPDMGEIVASGTGHSSGTAKTLRERMAEMSQKANR